MIETLSALKKDQLFTIGDIQLNDSMVSLPSKKLFGGGERFRFGWHDVHIWNHDGSFVIGSKNDKKTYGSASYIHAPNTHLIEHIIRGAFKKGVRKLSEYLED